MTQNITRRKFLKKAGAGALVLTASPSILSMLTTHSPSCFAQEIEAPVRLGIGPAQEIMQQAVKTALSRGADFADVYAERTIKRRITLDGGKITTLRYSVDQGVGIRVLSGDKTGYAFCESFTEQDVTDTANLAATLGKGNRDLAPISLQESALSTNVIPQKIALTDVSDDRKIVLMRQVDESARSLSDKIKNVKIEYYDELKQISIANSKGVYVHDTQPLVYFRVNALAAANGTRHIGHFRIGNKGGFELFDQYTAPEMAKTASESALRMLAAKDSPSGEMPVVVANGWGGVLFHEAVGHGLEGDAIAKGTSFFVDRLGQKVASEIVTFIDDATIPHLRGSYNYDDEGLPAARKVLIEKGILRSYMLDLLSAQQLKAQSTGNGRRQSFRYKPMVRMTNTFILGGEHNSEDIIKATKKGLYAKNFAGGVVDTTTGNFTFTVNEAYLIENGTITSPVKRMTLIGKGPEAMQSIDMVGHDLDFGPGSCGKGQWVPVTSGQPTLRLSKIVVGGTKA